MMDARILSNLADTVERSRELLSSRESVTQALVLPLFRALGYAIADPLAVRCGQPLELGEGESVTADIAIYDGGGRNLRLLVDVRPLGGDLLARSPLARALGGPLGVRFLVVTDGARYELYSDSQRVEGGDEAPFLAFSLVGPDADLSLAAEVLGRFARDAFDPGALVTRAEDDLLREALCQRLIRALRSPASDPEFIRWLSEGLYDGKRTRPVIERLGRLAEEAASPAILGVLSEEYIDALRLRLRAANEAAARPSQGRPAPRIGGEPEAVATIRAIAARAGAEPGEIVHRETTNYHGVGLKTPSRWFLRWFDGTRRRALTTLVPVDEARALVHGFTVEEAPQSFGVSRVLLEDPAQLWALEGLIARSLDLCRRGEQLSIA